MRFAHIVWAWVRENVGGFIAWADSPTRRAWAWPLVLVVAGVLAYPLDGMVAEAAKGWRAQLGGDVRRELEATQQFGQFVSMAFLLWAAWLLAPVRRRRLLDVLAAAVVALVAVNVLALLFGRARPDLADPTAFTGPFGLYPVPKDGGYVMKASWTAGYPLASMPSRHACFAAVAAVSFATLYPVLRPLVLTLAVIVACARVIVGAHYPADVFVGAGLGYLVASYAMGGFWGVRAVDWAWRRLIDPFAVPALPGVVAAEAEIERARRGV